MEEFDDIGEVDVFEDEDGECGVVDEEVVEEAYGVLEDLDGEVFGVMEDAGDTLQEMVLE